MDGAGPGAASPRPAAAAAATAASGEAAAPAAARRRGLGGVVGGDRAVNGVVEAVDHGADERAGVRAGVGAREVVRYRRLLADLDAVLLGPLLGAVEGNRPGDVRRVELLAAGEVEPLLAGRRGQHPAEAADPRPEVAAGPGPAGARAAGHERQPADRE